MGKKRRSFSTEFKHEAACLVVEQGYSMTKPADLSMSARPDFAAGSTNLKLNGAALRL